ESYAASYVSGVASQRSALHPTHLLQATFPSGYIAESRLQWIFALRSASAEQPAIDLFVPTDAGKPSLSIDEHDGISTGLPQEDRFAQGHLCRSHHQKIGRASCRERV